jgi:hypothetical protein
MMARARGVIPSMGWPLCISKALEDEMPLSKSSRKTIRTKVKGKNHQFKIHSLEDIMRIAKFSKPLTIALHPEVFDRVKQITDDEKRSMADWVREAVDQSLGRQTAEQADVTKQSNRNGGK